MKLQAKKAYAAIAVKIARQFLAKLDRNTPNHDLNFKVMKNLSCPI